MTKDQKPALLFLAHRIPFPPNKGDKIRSFNLLKALATDYRIYLGTFVDDPEDWQYEQELYEYCEELLILGLSDKRKYRSLSGFLTNEALSLPYYRFSQMQQWVDRTITEQNIERVFVFSSAMAQYVTGEQYQSLHRVVDFVDVDSEKWREYARRRRWPVSWIYRREANRLFDFDKSLVNKFDAALFVTREEANLFRSLVGATSGKIDYLNNGVDYHYFTPDSALARPYHADEQVLVFTGAMDYWANVDAVLWFAKEVFPEVKRQVEHLKFYIVGARPADEVCKLSSDAIQVTGAVKDIRPYILHADASVAPMRIARGVQNKVLEAMALGKAVIATSAAMEGIGALPGQVLCDTADTFVTECIRLLKQPDQALAVEGRNRVMQEYNWDSNLLKLESLLGDGKESGLTVKEEQGQRQPHQRLVGEKV